MSNEAINKLVKDLNKKMKQKNMTPTSISRRADMNVATVRKALNGDAKLSVYINVAKALGATIKITVE